MFAYVLEFMLSFDKMQNTSHLMSVIGASEYNLTNNEHEK